jgi:hypothetical protein
MWSGKNSKGGTVAAGKRSPWYGQRPDRRSHRTARHFARTVVRPDPRVRGLTAGAESRAGIRSPRATAFDFVHPAAQSANRESHHVPTATQILAAARCAASSRTSMRQYRLESCARSTKYLFRKSGISGSKRAFCAALGRRTRRRLKSAWQPAGAPAYADPPSPTPFPSSSLSRSTATTRSPSAVLNTITPLVWRPMMLISATPQRISWPPSVTSMS